MWWSRQTRATALGATERTAHGVVSDRVEAGYGIKEKEGRRNRYHIQDDLPLHEGTRREQTIGELLDLFVDPEVRRPAG